MKAGSRGRFRRQNSLPSVNRIPPQVAWIQQGVLDPTAELELKEITLVVAQVDGKKISRFVAANLSMAKTFGIGMVSIKHSNHFGMLA